MEKNMHKINLVVVGGLKEKYFKEAENEYLKRLGRFAQVEIKEVNEFLSSSKISVEQIKRTECEELLKKTSGFVVAMDKSGEVVSSEELSKLVSKTFTDGAKALTFVIGGSNGLTKEFLGRADKVVSFGKITYPHQLMRIILLEQIYRAETILNNVTYHK